MKTPQPPLDPLDMPECIRALPRSAGGYPVPFFVEWRDGRPNFRVMSHESFQAAMARRLCWICGTPTGRFVAFCGGPLMAAQRRSVEPPSHVECACYAAAVCPFMSNPTSVRGEDSVTGTVALGDQISENPGVFAVYVCRDFEVAQYGGGVMFEMAEPVEVRWFQGGDVATIAGLREAIETALIRYRRATAASPLSGYHETLLRERFDEMVIKYAC